MTETHRARRLAAVILAAVTCACRTEKPAPTTLVTYNSPMWYQETGSYFQPSPDGRRAVYGAGPRSRLYNLATGKEDDETWRHSLNQVRAGAFMPDGELLRLAASDNDTAWYVERDSQVLQLPIPPKALPRWSPNRRFCILRVR